MLRCAVMAPPNTTIPAVAVDRYLSSKISGLATSCPWACERKFCVAQRTFLPHGNRINGSEANHGCITSRQGRMNKLDSEMLVHTSCLVEKLTSLD